MTKIILIFGKRNYAMEIPEGLFHVERQYDTSGEVLIMDGLDYSKPDTIDKKFGFTTVTV